MVAVFSVLAGVSFLASLVAAQQPPACALTCANTAANDSGCKGLTDLKCLCNSEKFFDEAGTCTIQSCPPDEVEAAQAALQAICKGSATTSFSLDTSTISFTGSGGGSNTVSQTQSQSSQSQISQSSQSSQSGVSRTSTGSVQSTASVTSGLSTSSTASTASSTSTTGAAGKRAAVFGAAVGAGPAAAVALLAMVAGAAVAL